MTGCKVREHREGGGGQESAKVQTAVIKADSRDEGYFFDGPVWSGELEAGDVAGVVWSIRRTQPARTSASDPACMTAWRGAPIACLRM